jgi:hypothetical protein
MGNVPTRDDHRAIGRARPPKQCSVVAHSTPDRGEDEIGRQAEEQVVNSSRDRVSPGRDGIGITQGEGYAHLPAELTRQGAKNDSVDRLDR